MSIPSIMKVFLYALVAIFFVSCRSYGGSMQSSNMPSNSMQGTSNNTQSSGGIVTKSISVGAFRSIDIDSGSYDVVVSFSQTQDIKISAYENVIPMIYFRVQGYTLNINKAPLSFISSKIKISLSVSALEKISIDDDASVKLSVSGISGQFFEVEADGFLDATLSGNINYLDIEADGSSSINAKNLISKNAKVELDGRSSAIVHVTDALQVEVDDMGSVKYYGNPVRFSQKIEALGSIEKL